MAEGSMTRAEREAFMADLHVGVLAIDEPGRGPLASPIWYVYENGEVRINTGRDSVKAKLINAAGRASLAVQTEAAPYKYATIEGAVRIEDGWYDPLAMATRYLGPEFGKWYADNNPENDHSVTAV